MKNTHASSNQLYVDRPLDCPQAASLFQIARAETEPSRLSVCEVAARAAIGLCAAAALWVGVGSTLDLQRAQGTERFVNAAMQPAPMVAQEQAPTAVVAKSPAPAAPSYL